MFSVDYSNKKHCPHPAFTEKPPLKLTSIPQELIDIANSFLTLKEQAKLQSTSRYFNRPRPVETLDLNTEPLPLEVLSKDFFKNYSRFQNLFLDLVSPLFFDLVSPKVFLVSQKNLLPIDTYKIFQNPKLANVTKFQLNNFELNQKFYENLNYYGHKDFETFAENFFLIFKNRLINLSIGKTHSINLKILTCLTNLQILKIDNITSTNWWALTNLTNLTHLTVRSMNINLHCLSDLVKLTYLDLNSNHDILSIEPIKNLIKLKYLNLSKVLWLSNVEPLANLSQLEYLNLENISQNGFVNPGSIYYLSNLKTLNINFRSEIADFNYLKSLHQLTDLSIYIAGVTDFSPISELPKLQRLVCRKQNDLFPDYTLLFQMPSITELQLIGALNELPQDAFLPNLRSLNLKYNRDLTDISLLRSLTNLTALDISYTNVTELKPLSELTHLIFLSIAGYRGSTLQNLATLINLTLLDVSDAFNQSLSLSPLSELNKLKYLSIGFNYNLKPLNDLYTLKPNNLRLIDVYAYTMIPQFHQWLKLKYPALNRICRMERNKYSTERNIFFDNNRNLFDIIKNLNN